jgi:S-adenosylmethionine/arginine decarboxylase-like enzyme
MKYGVELVLDMSGCSVVKFNRRDIKSYFKQLCNLIDMEAEDLYFWDDFHVSQEKRQTNPKTKGTTAIQFILTSNITIHTLDLLGVVFVNIFSCKDYEPKQAEEFTVRYFEATKYKSTLIERSIA